MMRSHPATRRVRSAGRRERGGALLAVLWLAAGLTAIAFSVAATVRAETERTGNFGDALRAHYIATGAVERALNYVEWSWSHRRPDGSPWYETNRPLLFFEFPGGAARVDVSPETAKISINTAPLEEIARVLMHLGAPPPQIEMIIDGLQTFRGRGTSLQETEDLLLVTGMTPELFHGGHVRDAEGRLRPRSGAKHCFSVWGTTGQVDVNHADPAVLAALGVPPAVIPVLVERRHAMPFRTLAEAVDVTGGGPGFDRLQVGGGDIWTFRSEARLRLSDGRLSDLVRTAAATVKYMPNGSTPPYRVLRWYED